MGWLVVERGNRSAASRRRSERVRVCGTSYSDGGFGSARTAAPPRRPGGMWCVPPPYHQNRAISMIVSPVHSPRSAFSSPPQSVPVHSADFTVHSVCFWRRSRGGAPWWVRAPPRVGREGGRKPDLGSLSPESTTTDLPGGVLAEGDPRDSAHNFADQKGGWWNLL